MRKTVYAALTRVLALVLLAVGATAVAGGTYTQGLVTDQLKQEQIKMPGEDSVAKLTDKASQDALRPYIDQQLTTGPQARVFADHYIWQHMMASSKGRTYEDVSDAFMKAFKDSSVSAEEVAKLGQLRQTLFMGDTLRGLLLNAYGWWMVGSVAIYAGIGMVIAGAFLALLGFVALRPRQGGGVGGVEPDEQPAAV